MKMTFRGILNIIRACCLIIFALAIVIFYFWIFEGPLVDQLGQKIVKIYITHYQNKLDVALVSLKNNPAQGINQLEKLLADLGDIQKGDSLAPIKIKTLESLVSAQEQKNAPRKALTAAEKWSDFDNRDLWGQFVLARLLLKTSGREKEGVQVLHRLNKLAPANPMFSSLYAEISLKEDKLVEAFLALRHSLITSEVLKGHGWQIFWDNGNGFSADQSMSFYPTIDENGEFKIPFTLPVSTHALRLDPPPTVQMFIENPVLLRGNNKGQDAINLLDISLQFNQMSQAGKILRTSGGIDPFFVFDLPDDSDGSYTDYVFSARIQEKLPSLVNDILSHPDIDSLKPLLEASGETAAVDQLIKIRRKISRQSEFENQFLRAEKLIKIQQGSIAMFWHQGGEGFAEQRKIELPFNAVLKHDQLLFDFTFPINSTASQLRIDFPEGAGVQYSIDALNIYLDGRFHSINVDQTDTTVSQGLKKDGTRFVTIGPDPYFFFPINSEHTKIEKIRIQGRAQ